MISFYGVGNYMVIEGSRRGSIIKRQMGDIPYGVWIDLVYSRMIYTIFINTGTQPIYRDPIC